MKKIPCRQCKNCGKYSSINIDQCRCGEDLTALPGVAVEHNKISLPQMGRIDKDIPFFVRKCPVCSTEHFFTEAGGSVRRCRNCNKTQIQNMPTLPYEEEEKKPAPEPEMAVPVSPLVTGTWGDEDDDDDDDDIPGGSVYGSMMQNIRQATGAAPQAARPGMQNADDDDDDDDDDEDGGAGLWGQILSGKGAPAGNSGSGSRSSTSPVPQSTKPAVSTLTITAIRYGSMTLTLRSDSKDLPCLLGRKANCAAFLQQDPRVGSEHCWLDYRGGSWMVQEKRAINGTAINGNFLDEGGSAPLHDGDELMLGHHRDSMVFRVTIK